MSDFKESEHPRDADGKFTVKGNGIKSKRKQVLDALRKRLKPLVIYLPDEELPKSIGARWKNVPVRLLDGNYARLKDNSVLQNKQVIAGKGCRRKIDDVARLVRENKGTKPQDWQKIKAYGTIVYDDGEEEYVELHWYYEPSVGMIEVKVK